MPVNLQEIDVNLVIICSRRTKTRYNSLTTEGMSEGAELGAPEGLTL